MKAKPESYKRLKLLGEGSFGKAYLVQCESDKSLAVIKQIDIEAMDESERKDVLKEAKIMEKLIHPNIVKYREIYKSKGGLLCIVMEYADGGDLEAVIEDKSIPVIPENQIIDYICQICLALKHIHDRKILHRDLKSQNVFLTKNKTVKLGDFGISRILEFTMQKAKTMVGTPYYLAPEVISNVGYSFPSDLWSLGVIAYELCAKKYPFEGDSIKTLLSTIVKGTFQPIPATYSKEMKNLIESLLQVDPSKRPRVDQILKSNLLTSRIKNFLSETEYEEEFSHTIFHKINLFAPNQLTNSEMISSQKDSDIKNSLEDKSASVKVENKDKAKKLPEKKESKNESKKQDNQKTQEADSTLTAKILGELQKKQTKDEKDKQSNEAKKNEKGSLEGNLQEDSKEKSSNEVLIAKESEIKQMIKGLNTFDDIEELAKSIISKEMNNFEEKQKVRNEMKILISEEKKIEPSGSIAKAEHSSNEEDKGNSLSKQSPQKSYNVLKSSNIGIEDLINFLSKIIGKDKYLKCHDILKSTMATAIEDKNFDIYKKAAKGILSENDEKEYLNLFITLISIEQKLNKGK